MGHASPGAAKASARPPAKQKVPKAGPAPTIPGVYRVDRFVEKPDRATAERYLRDGSYLWNSGIFLFRADVILDEIRRSMSDLGEQLARIDAAIDTPRAARVLGEIYPRCPSISIDYGVMEKSDRLAVVPADFGWSDVGSFDALADAREQDAKGNVSEGEAMIFDGRNNVVLGLPGLAGLA